MAFPIVWAVYTLIRGPLAYNDVGEEADLVPLPVPRSRRLSPEGYVSVAFYVILIAGVIGGVGAVVIWVVAPQRALAVARRLRRSTPYRP